MKELNKLDVIAQMGLVEFITSITQEQLDKPSDELGCFKRKNTTFYRVRANEFRIYFELRDDIIYAHYILHKNTLADFIFRTKLPANEEFLAEQEDSFWKYLETL